MISTIIIFVVVLGLLVFVHEFGHFLTAKRAGAAVEEFGFGFPPRIVGIKRGETLYSINWIPLGGFVRIRGENGEGEPSPGSFVGLPFWKRALILVSGVGMNVLLAMVILSFVYALGAPTALDGQAPPGARVHDRKIQILTVMPDSPAATSGFLAGDAIQSIDGVSITSVPQAQQYNDEHRGIVERVDVLRGKTAVTVTVTPTPLPGSEDKAVWGVNLAETGTVSYPWYQALWLGVRSGASLLWQIIVAFVMLLKNLVVHQQVSVDIAGPVGIAAMTGQVATLGMVYLLQFIALLSLNLAVVNILPLPALDGGRLLFLIIERLRKRRLNIRVESLVHNIGFALLIVFALLVTVRDVHRYGGQILDFFGKLFGQG